jgi:hypothetical protein
MREKWYLFLKEFARVAFYALVWPFFKIARMLDRVEYRWRGVIRRWTWCISHKWDDYKYEQERGGL